MTLVPIMRSCNLEYLKENWNVAYACPEWVGINLNDTQYESNRYDIEMVDAITGKKISVYLYLDESNSYIYAIDDVVQDSIKKKVRYPLQETPFSDMINSIMSKFNSTEPEGGVEGDKIQINFPLDEFINIGPIWN